MTVQSNARSCVCSVCVVSYMYSHDSVCTASYCTPFHAASSIRYLVSVEALSGVGCSNVSEIDCYTVQTQPPVVEGVMVDRLNGTAMNVSWTPLNTAQSNGFIDTYIVTYSVVTATPNRKRQGPQVVTVSSDKSGRIIGGLDPGSEYNVGVTVTGPGGTSECECNSVCISLISKIIIIFLCPHSLSWAGVPHYLPHTLSVVPAQAHQHQRLS